MLPEFSHQDSNITSADFHDQDPKQIFGIGIQKVKWILEGSRFLVTNAQDTRRNLRQRVLRSSNWRSDWPSAGKILSCVSLMQVRCKADIGSFVAFEFVQEDFQYSIERQMVVARGGWRPVLLLANNDPQIVRELAGRPGR